MKILFDNGTPNAIASVLKEHDVSFARKIGWHELENGDLIRKAEDMGYDLLLSTDKNIRYQQNLKDRKIAIVILGNSQWPMVKLHLAAIVKAVDDSRPGSYVEVPIPFFVPKVKAHT